MVIDVYKLFMLKYSRLYVCGYFGNNVSSITYTGSKGFSKGHGEPLGGE